MPLRIISYNVRYFGHALRGASSTRGGLDAIATAIAGLEPPPDIVCLQEVETRSLRSRLSHEPGDKNGTQLEALMKQLELRLAERERPVRYTGYHFPAHVYRAGKVPIYTTGLAVLAAQDLSIEQTNVDQPHDITHRRIARVAKLKQSRVCAHLRLYNRHGESLDIFNTHLSLPSFATADFFTPKKPRMGYGENQQKEVDRLADFISQTSASDRFIVLGDFNSLPESPAYNHLLSRLPVTDPFPSALKLSPIELRSAWPTAGFMHLRMRLDHFFVGPGLELIDLDDSHPFGQAGGRWHGLSDHVPLVGRFRVR
ncbi:MAG: endonuclease/exonuclease/phosphatase family protein [Deltaproteobacteria bacterium]|nr:endonuclease/exonuclease/phosphatase family protein [Deltaproteobacteria bacterium]